MPVNVKQQTKAGLMLYETVNPNGVDVPSDYNSYAGSLGSAMNRRAPTGDDWMA